MENFYIGHLFYLVHFSKSEPFWRTVWETWSWSFQRWTRHSLFQPPPPLIPQYLVGNRNNALIPLGNSWVRVGGNEEDGLSAQKLEMLFQFRVLVLCGKEQTLLNFDPVAKGFFNPLSELQLSLNCLFCP